MKSLLKYTILLILISVWAHGLLAVAEQQVEAVGTALQGATQNAADATIKTGVQVAEGVQTAASGVATGVSVAKDAIKDELAKGVGGVAKDAVAGAKLAVTELIKAIKNGDVATFQANAREAGQSFHGESANLTDLPVVGETVDDIGPLKAALKSVKITDMAFESGILEEKIPVGGKSRTTTTKPAEQSGQTKMPKLGITEMRFSGKAMAFGAASRFALVLDVMKKGGYAVIMPGELKFSQINDVFKPLDGQIELKNPEIIVSTISDRYKGVTLKTYQEGASLLATFVLKGFIAQVLGKEITINGSGFISRKVGFVDSEFGAELGTEFDLGAGLKTEKSRFSVKIKPEGLTMGIATGLKVAIPNQQNPLIFRTRMSFDTFPTGKVSIDGDVEGEWKEAFGVPFLNVRNVGIGAAKAYASGNQPITEFEIKGGLDLGNKKVDLVVQVKMPPAGEKSVSAIGTFQGGLSLADIVNIASAIVKKNIDGSALPALGIKDAKLYIVTENSVSIFGKSYSRGVYIAGNADLFGKKAKLVFMIDPKKGITAEGYLEKIDIGVLKLTGAGPDKQMGTADDGATVDIQLNTSKQGIFISCDAELNMPGFGPAFKETVAMAVNTKGASFQMHQDILGFAMIIDVTLPISDIKSSHIKMTAQQDALAKMQGFFNGGLDLAKNEANKAVNEAKAALDKAKNDFGPFKDLEDKMHAAENRCADAGKQILNAARTATKAIASAGKAIGGAIGDFAGDAWGAVTSAFGGGSKSKPDPLSWIDQVPNKPAGYGKGTGILPAYIVSFDSNNINSWVALGTDKLWENIAYAIKAGLPVAVIRRLFEFMAGSVTPDKIDTVRGYDAIMPSVDMAIIFAGEVGNSDAKTFLDGLRMTYMMERKQAEMRESAGKAAVKVVAPEAQKQVEKLKKSVGAALEAAAKKK